MGFQFFRGKKYERVTNDREMRVLDDGKHHMCNREKGDFGITAAAHTPG